MLDYDFFADYPPEVLPDALAIPDGYKLVTLRGFAPEQIPLMLQRAKVVIDLALPGPERLAGEAVLMGAVPIVSHRWNGASEVDFPGLIKVQCNKKNVVILPLVRWIL